MDDVNNIYISRETITYTESSPIILPKLTLVLEYATRDLILDTGMKLYPGWSVVAHTCVGLPNHT